MQNLLFISSYSLHQQLLTVAYIGYRSTACGSMSASM